MKEKDVRVVFRFGDPVVLARGTYQGTQGVFLELKTDENWANITERNGRVRCHPMAWIDHLPDVPGVPSSAEPKIPG